MNPSDTGSDPEPGLIMCRNPQRRGKAHRAYPKAQSTGRSEGMYLLILRDDLDRNLTFSQDRLRHPDLIPDNDHLNQDLPTALLFPPLQGP